MRYFLRAGLLTLVLVTYGAALPARAPAYLGQSPSAVVLDAAAAVVADAAAAAPAASERTQAASEDAVAQAMGVPAASRSMTGAIVAAATATPVAGWSPRPAWAGAAPLAANVADFDADGNLLIYTDALGRNWFDWSWADVESTYTGTNGGVAPHTGDRAIAADLGGYAAFSPFFSNGQNWTLPEYTGLTTTGFDRLSFWVHHGAGAGGQTVRVQAADILPGWAWRHAYAFTVPTDDVWHEIVVPLSELDAVDTHLARVAWSGSTATDERLLLDDIKLLKAPAPIIATREPMSDTASVHWLYRDERATRLDGSWSAEIRFQATPASRGSFSLGAQFGWFGGLQFRPLNYDWQDPQPFATGTGNVLQFDLNRGPLDPASQTYNIYAQDSGGNIVFKAELAHFIAGGAFDTDPATWQAVTVPLDILAGGSDGIYAWGIQEANGVNGWTADWIYLDEIRFAHQTEPPNLAVYTDTLAPGWTAGGSWDATVDLTNPAPVLTGTASLAATYLAPWAGLYLHADPAISLVGYHTLRFWIHSGATGGQSLQLWLHDDEYHQGTAVTVTIPLTDTWQLEEVSLADLGNPLALSAIAWQDGSGSPGSAAAPAFYLDEISLTTASAPLPPAHTGPALQVDVAANRHAISPDIYGINFADEALATELQLPVRRWGGNSTTRYNWQNDTSNHAGDWYFENIPEANANPAALPAGSTTDRFVEQDRRTGTRTILTVPLIGYTPKSRGYACAFSVALYGAQQSVDPWRTDCGNGKRADGTALTGNNPLDTSLAIDPTFVQAWLTHLVSLYGRADAGGVAYYNLDNEPMLWNSTHRDVHPLPASYDEVRDRTYAYAAAVKAIDPSAKTLGPVLWGWSAYFFSALDAAGSGSWWNNPLDRNAHGGTPFVVWYLQQMQAYEQTHGVRILDYLDLHYYPQASGVALSAAGSAATQTMRLRSTRALWDPTYIDESWINESVQLIPRMREWVTANYPGTKLALTEYNWGGLESINGALAQADVLGIFGREGLDLATLWAPPTSAQPGAFAFRMFRRYDPTGVMSATTTFGETSVFATSANQGQLSIYAAERADGALTVLVINKTRDAVTSAVTLAHIDPAASAEAAVYRYSPANLHAIVREADQAVEPAGSDETASFSAEFPGQSITLFVLPRQPVAPTVAISRAGAGVVLRWDPMPADSDGYLVWSSTAPYFQLSDDSAISDTLPAAMTVYTNTAALAGPAPRFFVVQGLNATGQASEPSARLGVFSFNVFVGP